jgi:hypothetical protein
MLVIKLYRNFRPCVTELTRPIKLMSVAAAFMIISEGDFLFLADM